MASRPKHQLPAGTGAPWYEFRAQTAEDPSIAELHIFGVIGDSFFDPDAPSGKKIAKELAELPDEVKTIRVLVNSPGGNVYDGQHIFNALKRQRENYGRDVVVEIEGMALSAATLVTSAGDPIRMPANAIYMVHNPWFFTMGNATQLREDANILDKIAAGIVATYRWVSSLTADAIQKLMDEETWMDAEEALANGFVTEVVQPAGAAARASFGADILEHFDIPAEYRDRVMALLPPGGPEDGAAADKGGGSDPAADEEDNRIMSYLSRVKSWFSTQANEEPSEPPATDDTPGAGDEPGDAADAVDVLALCREAGCLAIAEPLIRARATSEQAEAAVARAKQIRSICEAGGVAELAAGLIDTDMTVAATRAHVAQITAHVDSTEIHGQIDPEARVNGKPRIDVVAVYQQLNGVTPTQET